MQGVGGCFGPQGLRATECSVQQSDKLVLLPILPSLAPERHPLTTRLFAAACLLIGLLTPLATRSAAQSKALPTKPLDLDRLYTLPSIIGTKPEQPVWSPDSRRLAFLWNDEGTPFLDLWLTDVTAAKPTRITHMSRPAIIASDATDVHQLEQIAHAEFDHGISSAVWSADGQRLLFLLQGQLFEVSPGQQPRRLAETLPAVAEIIPAPVGSDTALLTASGDIYLLNTLQPLYRSPAKDVIAEELHWSPDGERIAFIEGDLRQVPLRGIPNYLTDETTMTMVKRPFPGEPSESRRIGILSARSGRASPIRWATLDGTPMDLLFGFSWSPDSHTLLVDRSDLYIKDRRLLLIDTSTGASTLLLRQQDPKNVTAEWWSSFSPDGKSIYFTSDHDTPDYQVYVKPLTPAPPTPVTSGNFAVFASSLAARSLFITTNQGSVEERQTFRVPIISGVPQQLTFAHGTHTTVPSPDGHYLADIFSSDSTPPDLYLVDTSDLHPPLRPVTHSPLPDFHDYRWSIARYVDFPNVHDGINLHARLTLPPDFDPHRKYPAILGSVYSNSVHNQWGGRIFHPTWGLDQYLAQQGYVILNVDISGSSGYGKAFRQRLAQDYGGVDVDDLYSGVQYLIAQGFVNPRRVGIWGSSYGGLLTSTSLFTHPGTFQAGVAGAPATSLFHALTGEMRTMMDPQHNMAQYAKSSAFLKSAGLEDHLMIIHGMKDQVVLFKDSVTLTQRLILEGKDVTLVPLPDAPHGWDTEGLAQTRYAYHKLVDYFKTYLGEGPTPP